MFKNILFLILFFVCCPNVIGVCPVVKIQPIEEIKEEIKKQLNPILEHVVFSQTPTGFVISVENEILFNSCNEINLTGKLLLVQMSQIMKTSGHKWQIYCHSITQATEMERIAQTTEQAVKITHFLIEHEKCLLHQINPIGFGSIMPDKKLTAKQSQNRTDFIVENFEFSR